VKTVRIFLFCLFFLGLVVSCSENKTAAKINGEKISVADLDKSLDQQMQKIQKDIYDLRRGGLENVINQKLLEDAAKGEGLSVDAYVKREVDDKVSGPTEAELKALYDARQLKDQAKFEEIKDQIYQFILQNRKNTQQQQLTSQLRNKAKVEIFLQPPRVKVDPGEAPVRGPEKASVTLIEFSDYECPFCGRARPTINQILETYPNDIRYYFVDFPLSFHRNAFLAHEAAHCAGDQGKYWELNRKLFENQRALGENDIKKYANDLQIDMNAFQQCLATHKYKSLIEQNIEKGQMSGVSGTPAFFINGIMLSGARPFQSFKEVIDEELKQ